MDGICTVVDAKHVSTHLDKKDETGKDNEACAQIAYADRVILNKVDLLQKEELQALQQRLRAINGLAVMQEAEKSVVPVDYVLGIGGFALSEVSAQVCAVTFRLAACCAAYWCPAGEPCQRCAATVPSQLAVAVHRPQAMTHQRMQSIAALQKMPALFDDCARAHNTRSLLKARWSCAGGARSGRARSSRSVPQPRARAQPRSRSQQCPQPRPCSRAQPRP